jgi:hypothetical protein
MMLESVKGHLPGKTVDDRVFIVMEQACWRLPILGESKFLTLP